MYSKLKKAPKLLPAKMRRSEGTSLIEVLISVLILGIGLLGIASMQAITLRNGQSSMGRSQAVMQTYSNMARTCAVPTTTATQAQRDLRNWMTSVQDNLGATACGTVLCGVDLVCTVTVDWNDSRGTAGATVQRTITRSRI